MKIAIVATPRTGSTWLYQLILKFMRRKDPRTLGLEEYFNVLQLHSSFHITPAQGPTPEKVVIYPLEYVVEYQGKIPPGCFQLDYGWGPNGVERRDRPQTDETVAAIRRMIKAKTWPAFLQQKSHERLENLRRDPRKNVVIKLMAPDFIHNNQLTEFLVENYRLILLKRENIDRQIKSYCQSCATGVWDSVSPAESDLCDDRAPLEPKWVKMIEDQIAKYHEIRDQLLTAPGAQEVSYEQLCEWQTPLQYLDLQNSCPPETIHHKENLI